MKWKSTITEAYQETAEGTARAHSKYYIYKVRVGVWRAGRYTFGAMIDYRETFSTIKEARAFCEEIDRETLIIVEVRA